MSEHMDKTFLMRPLTFGPPEKSTGLSTLAMKSAPGIATRRNMRLQTMERRRYGEDLPGILLRETSLPIITATSPITSYHLTSNSLPEKTW